MSKLALKRFDFIFDNSTFRSQFGVDIMMMLMIIYLHNCSISHNGINTGYTAAGQSYAYIMELMAAFTTVAVAATALSITRR